MSLKIINIIQDRLKKNNLLKYKLETKQMKSDLNKIFSQYY